MNTEELTRVVLDNPDWEKSIKDKIATHERMLDIEDTLRACGFDHVVNKAYEALGEVKTTYDKHITPIIAAEERLFNQLVEKARAYFEDKDITTISGEEWAHLHETYGYDPSIGEMVLGTAIPEDVYQEYEYYRNTQKNIGRKGFKKEIIKAKTA